MAARTLNIRFVLHILGIVALFESVFMLLDVLVACMYNEWDIVPLLKSTLITGGIGALMFMATGSSKRCARKIGLRESFLLVTLAWILMSVLGALPYILTKTTNVVDGLFESFSGFTTTGSSIFNDIEALPKGILFWRSETHWIGGMGIIMLIVALLPILKSGGIKLFSAESSASIFEKIKPKIVHNAQHLWIIYMILTVVEMLLLVLGGMGLFDATCHAFGTIATGGFSTRNLSVAAYSPYIQYVITLFMFLSGVNFLLHARLIKGDYKSFFKNEEFRLYTGIILVVSILIAVSLVVMQNVGVEKAFRDALFQVVSIITATGFATADYLIWPTHCWLLIFFLMFIGASAGSTGGGIKVIRHLIAFRYLANRFKIHVNRGRLVPVRYNGTRVEDKVILNTFNFIFVYLLIYGLGVILMVIEGNDITTSAGSIITAMGGIGPGLGLTGPASNFAMLSGATKITLTLFMLLGRLEILPVLVLFQQRFWKR
ncbi:TrkH family potassium uptake protein [Prolixibacteraceae bacterium JC049]|nr:TrkH family potassium uptake protein [Prolixibacteraceae bacterium JC049]